jgi:PAS domain S-box-containing protein
MQVFPESAAAPGLFDAASALGDVLPQMLWLADSDGSHVYANAAWREYTGLTSLSPDWRLELVHPDDVERLRQQWNWASRQAQPYTAECRFRRSDGAWRWLLDRTVPVGDNDGKVTHWLGTLTDIHELKSVELELTAAVRERNEYLATLGHELRTPLQALRQALYVLKLPDVSDDDAARMHRTAENQILEIKRFCEEILDVNKVRWDALSLRLERVTIQLIVDDAVAAASPQIQSHGHSLDVRVADPCAELTADRLRMAQALINLLDNAAKYTPRRGRIVLTAAKREDAVEFVVEDTGDGIASETLPHIFDLFARGAPSSKSGFGIGLALVRQVVMLHGGAIEVHSDGPGRGSRFSLRIPADRSPES